VTSSETRELLYRRRYLIPNAVTVGNMFCGFLSILYSAEGKFSLAILAIVVAILLDGVDGRVARKLNATSEFGLEFDSLADLISFGVAPGMLVFYWAFSLYDRDLGVLFTFAYAVCAASRLARYNISTTNLKGFTGLPSPGAAAAVAALVYLYPSYLHDSLFLRLFVGLITVSIGYLMVSRVSYLSIKQTKIPTVQRQFRLVVAILIGLIWLSSRAAFFIIAFGYCLSGPGLSFYRAKLTKYDS
jgi:CDP-diacylglycerol---serine O-phosphatidyltransferase